jgi:hypothetical protein
LCTNTSLARDSLAERHNVRCHSAPVHRFLPIYMPGSKVLDGWLNDCHKMTALLLGSLNTTSVLK